MVFKASDPKRGRRISPVLFNHAAAAVSYTFDESNLVSAAGLAPVIALAQKAGLAELAQQKVAVFNTGADKGANAWAKTSSLVAGADSIDDMNLLRHGGMSSLFDAVYAPSTLGSHLREYQFGHVRQLEGFPLGHERGTCGLPGPPSGQGRCSPPSGTADLCRTRVSRGSACLARTRLRQARPGMESVTPR